MTRPTRGDRQSSRVSELQRARIVSALLEACAERGAAEVTVADVVGRAGVSRRTFYELFSDCEDCLLAALQHAASLVSERVLEASDLSLPWRRRVRAAVISLLGFFEEEPLVGRVLIVESLTAGKRALELRAEIVGKLAAAVHEGSLERGCAVAPSPLVAEGAVGAGLSLVHTRMSRRDRDPLMELANPLVSMIVLPYLGQAAARRELQALVPAPHSGHTSRLASPLKELEIRVTYRTMRVIDAIGEHPGASNRQIGLAAGIKDQGQISKLLARLHQRGLVRNDGDRKVRGAANAWTLTSRGQRLRQALASRPDGCADRLSEPSGSVSRVSRA